MTVLLSLILFAILGTLIFYGLIVVYQLDKILTLIAFLNKDKLLTYKDGMKE